MLLIANKSQLSVAFLNNHSNAVHLVDRIHLVYLQVYTACVFINHFVYITYSSI